MSELILVNLLGVFGLAIFAFGMLLFYKGKRIEEDISQGPVTKKVWLFNNWGPNYIGELWGPNGTKPLAYLCIVVGTVFLLIFASSLF
jgi:hypothetical protein